MALFGRNRIFGAQAAGPKRASAAGFSAWVLIGAAVTLLAAQWVEPSSFERVRGQAVDLLTPVVAGWAAIAEPVSRASGQVAAVVGARLEAPASQAAQARLVAQAARADDLERENADLRRLARFTGAAGVPRVSARVVARSPDGLTRSVLIGAGRNQGIRDGYPVVSGDGLTGRVVLTHEDSASVMLLGDRLSRVPVYIGQQLARGLLVGTGAALPRLEFVAGAAPINEGDVVTTSGLGGVFPRGLAVGVVAGDASGWRVRLAAEETPFTVGVLQVEIPSSDASDALSRKVDREGAGVRGKAVVK